MTIVNIPLLQNIGSTFDLAGTKHKIMLTNNYIETQLEKMDKNVYLYSDYCTSRSIYIDNTYIFDTSMGEVLNNVYGNNHKLKHPILKMIKYDKNFHTIICEVNDTIIAGKKLLDIIDSKKVYITFVYSYADAESGPVDIVRAALCFGMIGDYIFYI